MELSLAGQELSALPDDFFDRYGVDIESLDLTDNSVSNLDQLSRLSSLKVLVLDKNGITPTTSFPKIPSLKTLWLNDNQLDDLETLISSICASFPQLNYLSLLKNECCPDIFRGASEADYRRYRIYIIKRLPSLRFLDASPVTETERQEAARIGSALLTPKRKHPQTAAHQRDPSLVPDVDDSPIPCKFGVAKYQYTGRHSEGNRYITNSCL
ncbi:hypothetical protein P9112_001728 [Eukaryota sp. TZLM1-RC]